MRDCTYVQKPSKCKNNVSRLHLLAFCTNVICYANVCTTQAFNYFIEFLYYSYELLGNAFIYAFRTVRDFYSGFN